MNEVGLQEQTDVVVLGAGLAGHCAALSAAERGASVVLLEKTAHYGGSTLRSSGSFAFAATDMQSAQGIEDSAERLFQDILQAGDKRNDPELVDLYVREQQHTFDWLRAQGVIFHSVALSSGMSVPRSHPADPRQLVDALNERVAMEGNVQYREGVAVESLVVEDDRSVGLRLQGGQTILARGGIVLATGGFSLNPALIEKYAPRLATALAVGGSGCEGDGLMMALALGAAVVDMEFITGTFGMSLNRYSATRAIAEDQPLLRLAIFRGAIAVNLEGARFTDESISYKLIGERCLAQPNGIAFQIWDQRIMDQSVPAPTSNDYRGAFEQGLILKAGSIAELAVSVGLDPSMLAATLARYNTDARSGKDHQFGRHSLGGGYGRIAPIDQAPFYIYPCTTGILGTYCGLRVNRAMQVLRTSGGAVMGMYAAGEIVGGLHGSGYMSGTALAKAAVFGRVAGSSAASQGA